jgi:hypothetical protein
MAPWPCPPFWRAFVRRIRCRTNSRSSTPHGSAGCFETVEGQIEFESSRVKRGGMKPGSLIVKIRHHAGMDAVNALKMKHRGLIDFNARKGSTLNHENIPKNLNQLPKP